MPAEELRNRGTIDELTSATLASRNAAIEARVKCSDVRSSVSRCAEPEPSWQGAESNDFGTSEAEAQHRSPPESSFAEWDGSPLTKHACGLRWLRIGER